VVPSIILFLSTLLKIFTNATPKLIQIDPDQNTAPIEAFPSGSKKHRYSAGIEPTRGIVLASPRSTTRRTLVDEEQLLDHLDLVRLHLPVAFRRLKPLSTKKKEILLQAEQHAEKIIQVAEARAAQILNEMDIIQLAELEAKQIQQEQECEVAKEQRLG